MAKSVVAVLSGVFLSVCFLATVRVGAQTVADPAAPLPEESQPADPAADPAAVPVEEPAPVKKTPQAAIDWYQKQLQRMEQQQRAIELRKAMMQYGESQPVQPE